MLATRLSLPSALKLWRNAYRSKSTFIIPVKVSYKKMNLKGIGYHKLNLLTALRRR